MRKKSSNIFFVIFICEKYLFWTNFRFLGPFFGGGDNIGGGKFFLLFSSHFERLLLQLQTLQVSEGVLGKKYFFNRPWSQKNLMSSWGEGGVGVLPFSILYMFSALWLGPTLATMSLLFTPYSPQPIKVHFSSVEKKFFSPS